MARAAALAVVVAGLLLSGCGEPPVDVAIPARGDGQQILDLAGILRAPDLSQRLRRLHDQGLDIVVLTYESEQAGCGEAFRAGGEIVASWDADVALVAVAQPGDFTATGDDRERCLGVRPRDSYEIPGSLRERIAEQLVPPLASRNDWHGAFSVAVDALAAARRASEDT